MASVERVRPAAGSETTSQAVRAKHRAYLFPAVANYYEEPIVLVEGRGVRVRDLDGTSYLDCFGGILTVSVGHADADVNAAVIAQIGRLTHVSSVYPTLPVVELAARLAAIAPGGLEQCFFTASGTEANETAVMMAQLHTGRSEVIALQHGYSGRSMLGQALTGLANWRALPGQIAAVRHAPAPYCYRCPYGLTHPDCGLRCAREIEQVIRTTTRGEIAAFLAEPILGLGGVIVPPPEYFSVAVEIVRRHGGLFVSDEVQTGFGRTGTWWGCEQHGVVPDLMTMAKGIANGLPLSATVTTPAIAGALRTATISTFGGNPVACAAANATLEAIERRDLIRNAATMGERMRDGLERLRRDHPRTVGDVRGMGLMLGVELVVDEARGDRTPNPKAALRMLEETRRRGLLIGRGGLHGNVLRIAPPLSIEATDVDEALAGLEGALASIEA